MKQTTQQTPRTYDLLFWKMRFCSWTVEQLRDADNDAALHCAMMALCKELQLYKCYFTIVIITSCRRYSDSYNITKNYTHTTSNQPPKQWSFYIIARHLYNFPIAKGSDIYRPVLHLQRDQRSEKRLLLSSFASFPLRYIVSNTCIQHNINSMHLWYYNSFNNHP